MINISINKNSSFNIRPPELDCLVNQKDNPRPDQIKDKFRLLQKCLQSVQTQKNKENRIKHVRFPEDLMPLSPRLRGGEAVDY